MMGTASYDEFAKMLVAARSVADHRFTAITFNYDLGLDFALHHCASLGSSYVLDEEPPDQAVVCLKLHGSINWGLCSMCGKIVPTPFPVMGFLDSFVRYDLGTRVGDNKHCEQPLEGPVIVPPTWNKTGYGGQLPGVWRRAAQALAGADNLFIIGYSMPGYDEFFRYLFALGSHSRNRFKRVWVFNPDDAVGERFGRLLGPDARRVYKQFSGQRGTFRDAIPYIGSALTST